jgi:hypothetical protein
MRGSLTSTQLSGEERNAYYTAAAVPLAAE